MPLSLPSLAVALKCDENELETYDVKQEGPNSISASVASEAGKVSVPRIPLVSTRRLTVEVSNSESSCITICWTPILRSTCILMECALKRHIWELESVVKYQESESPPPRSSLSSFRSWNSSVRSPSIPWVACLFLICYRRSRLG